MITCQWLALDMAWQCHARGFPTHKQWLAYTRTVIHDLTNTEIWNFTGHYSNFPAPTVLCKKLQFPMYHYTTLLGGQWKTFVLLLLAINCPSLNLRCLIGYSFCSIRYISIQLCMFREKIYLKKWKKNKKIQHCRNSYII